MYNIDVIKIALGVKIPGFSYEELFVFAKAVGFDGIQYLSRMQDLLIYPQDVSSLSKKYSLDVIAVHQPLLLLLYTPQILFKNLISIRSLFPEMTDYIVHLSGFQNILQKGAVSEVFYKIGKEKNIIVSFESNPKIFPLQLYPQETYDPSLYAKFCNKHSIPMVMDTSHLASMGGDIVDFYKSHAESITVIHMSDFKEGVEHLPLKNGILPIDELLQEIKNNRKKPLIIFEISHMFEKSSKEKLLREIKSSLLLVRKILH